MVCNFNNLLLTFGGDCGVLTGEVLIANEYLLDRLLDVAHRIAGDVSEIRRLIGLPEYARLRSGDEYWRAIDRYQFSNDVSRAGAYIACGVEWREGSAIKVEGAYYLLWLNHV